MPLYNYECSRHGSFSEWRTMSESEDPVACPECGRPAHRGISTPHLKTMDSGLRRARSIEERSAHEPRVVRRRRGDPIPSHDAHRDLSQVRAGHSETHHHHGHAHGGATTHRSDHPWLVRH